MENTNNTSFLGSDTTKILKMVNLNDQLKDLEKSKDFINESRNKLMTKEENDIVDVIIENKSLEEIEKMAEKEVLKAFDNEFDEDKTLSNEDKKDANMKREFIIYCKKSKDTFDKIDEESAKLNEEYKALVKEFNEEIDAQNLDQLLLDNLQKRYDEEKNEVNKKKLENIIDSLNNAINLNNIKRYMIGRNTKNIVRDFTDDKTSQSIYKKYLSAMKSLNLTTDLSKFADLEKKFLPEEYHDKNNFFIYTIIRYISYKKDSVNRITDGVFISQLSINLKDLYRGNMREERKELFLENIKHILKYF